MNAQEIRQYRQEADEFFRTHPQSPLTPEQREHFTGMDWFPYNPDLALILDAEEFVEKLGIILPRSSEKSRRRSGGVCISQWRGRRWRCCCFTSPEHDYFSLGFWDATSGAETYGGGRYLDPLRLPDGRFEVDFNRAYNNQFSCIIPAAENRLPVRIEAGQQAFKK